MEQMNIEQLQSHLETMRNISVAEIEPESLTELRDIKIDPDLPVEKRVLSLLRQTSNPYAYLDNGMVVKISFSETGRTLQSCMEEYLTAELLPDIR